MWRNLYSVIHKNHIIRIIGGGSYDMVSHMVDTHLIDFARLLKNCSFSSFKHLPVSGSTYINFPQEPATWKLLGRPILHKTIL